MVRLHVLAAGRVYAVTLLASDHRGALQGPGEAGSLAVEPSSAWPPLLRRPRRAARSHSSAAAMHVSRLDAELLDAVVRLVKLLNSPNDTGFLAPLVMREIVYKLLKGAQGDRLHQIASLGGTTNRIAEAIERMRIGRGGSNVSRAFRSRRNVEGPPRCV